MKKELSEMVFPVENYTDKIHTGVKATMANYSHLSFTLHQLRPYLQAGYPWLKNLTERQATLLDQIIKTGLAKLVQLGLVKKVTSKVQVEPQWQWASKVEDSGYIDITSQDDVAQTDEAKKAVKRRAIGGRSLWKLNGTGKSVYLQGRNKDRKLVARLSGKPYHMTRQNVPHELATSFDVYWR